MSRESHRAQGPQHEAAIGSAPYVRRRRAHRSGRRPRPRLLQLLATGGSGGAQESYTGLLLHLDRERYDVEAISLSAGSAVRRLEELGLRVDVITESDDAAAIGQLAGVLRDREIDLVHNHMHRAEVVGTLAASEAGTPVVISTVHSSRVRSADDIATLAALTPSIDRIIVPSTAIARKVVAEGRGSGAVSVVPNGISLERFAFAGSAAASVRAELGLGESDLVFGMVARLEPEKGHRYLLDAVPAVVAECPAAWFAIVGEGSLAAELRRHADSLPARAGRRVLLTGRRDDVVAVTAAFDVAVLPSLREAQGISLLEAMALGKPIVASDTGGIPEVVREGVEGLLVPPGDVGALADALLRLARDAGLRARLADAGRKSVEERYSLQAMVRRIETIYDEELIRAGVTSAEPGDERHAAMTVSAVPERRRPPGRELPPTEP